MLYRFAFLLILLTSSLTQAQFSANVLGEEEVDRKHPVTFSHQPFLLFKITPTALLGRDNVLQYGVELAPPFGKFSFGFDYGKGKGSNSLNKEHKAAHPEQETRIIRGEIRTYFSDWYPFYSLDKKPFGRYYALEYVQKDISYTSTPIISLYADTQVEALPIAVKNVERAFHVKIGNHFIVTRWFFVDAYAGIGVGQYSASPSEFELEQESNAFNFKKPERNWSDKGLFLSKTAGIRLCLPL